MERKSLGSRSTSGWLIRMTSKRFSAMEVDSCAKRTATKGTKRIMNKAFAPFVANPRVVTGSLYRLMPLFECPAKLLQHSPATEDSPLDPAIAPTRGSPARKRDRKDPSTCPGYPHEYAFRTLSRTGRWPRHSPRQCRRSAAYYC